MIFHWFVILRTPLRNCSLTLSWCNRLARRGLGHKQSKPESVTRMQEVRLLYLHLCRRGVLLASSSYRADTDMDSDSDDMLEGAQVEEKWLGVKYDKRSMPVV